MIDCCEFAVPRYKITIEYDGTPFVGWQMQENGPSVQAAIVSAIKDMTAEEVQVFGAGRTDAGVHARGQVAHFDLTKHFPGKNIRDGLNHHLGTHPVSILSAEEVGDDFDARFSAVKRHYLYRILTRRAPLSLDRGRVWHVPVTLDAEKMNRAAQALVGKHDFTTFRASQCQAQSPVKTLDAISVERIGDDEINISVSAPSFLHNQVRSIAGSLKSVGDGAWAEEIISEILQAKDRQKCGQTAPPEGLYLMHVDYPSLAK